MICFAQVQGVLPLIEAQAGAEAFVQETGHEKILEYLFDEKVFEYLSWLLINKANIGQRELKYLSFIKTCFQIVYSVSGLINLDMNDYFEETSWLNTGGYIKSYYDTLF